MKSIILMGLTGILAVTGLGIGLTDKIQLENITPAVSAKTVSDLPKGDVREYEIQKGDTFAEVMNAQGVSYSDALAILDSAKGVFDFTKVGAGKVLKFVFVNEAFAAMEYPLNSETVVHVKKEANIYAATKEDIKYDITEGVAQGTITDSLFVTAQKAGIEDKVTLEIADIFSSDVDFATDIREGDSFAVVYEKRSLDGKDAGAGKVVAARFTNGGTTYTAYRYNDTFYDADGNSIARQFLKSPLNYARISSGFSYQRTNPVTKQVTPHRAIDYAADSGTPVIATADGKVITAGTKGGLGITVELKHGGYMTQYAHLSKIAKDVKTGVTVNQGDVIGYVGSTGISTGPHLQYAMFNDGNPINPLTAEFPRGDAVAQSEKQSFDLEKEKLSALLN